MLKNPFVTYGYEGPEYFCDRVQETESLTGLLQNGNNVVLMSPRRMGKTGLLMHSFGQAEVAEEYNTLLIDIYATSNLQDLVFSMGKAILSQLMPRGQKALSRFVKTVSSLLTATPFHTSARTVTSSRFLLLAKQLRQQLGNAVAVVLLS